MSERPYGFNSTLRTSGPIARFNPERRARRQSEGLVYGPHWKWVMRLPCILRDDSRHTCHPIMDAHHVKTTGSGGIDEANCVPLCRNGHRLDGTAVHVIGHESFETHWGISLFDIALDVWERSPYNAASKLAREFDAAMEAQQRACRAGIHVLPAVMRGGRPCCPACSEVIRP